MKPLALGGIPWDEYSCDESPGMKLPFDECPVG